MLPNDTELFAIRQDLEAIRTCLIQTGLGDAREMAYRLHSVVERFRTWSGAGLVDRESVEVIQKELQELQPLFENAYALHAGWFQMIDAGGAGQYDGNGQPV
jgi:hypothetical protein